MTSVLSHVICSALGDTQEEPGGKRMRLDNQESVTEKMVKEKTQMGSGDERGERSKLMKSVCVT